MRNRLRVAISDGNWSDPSIWNDNSVPEERDVVSLNGQHVVMDQDVTVFGLNNVITTPINSYTYLTFNDEPEGIAESSNNSQYAWYPFGNTNAYYSVPGVTVSNPFWVSYEYPNQEPILLKKYQFNGYSNNHPFNPSSWLFQAWDGSTWVTLEDRTNYGGNYTTYIGDLSSNTTAYYKYRIYVTQLYGGPGYSTINLTYVRFWEDKSYTSNSIDGGDLTISSSKTLTVSQSLNNGGYVLLYCNPNSESTVNLNLSTRIGANTDMIRIEGTSTYNLTGEVIQETSYYQRFGAGIVINSPCILNVVGNVGGGGTNPQYGIRVNSGGSGSIINIVGDVKSGGGIGSAGVGLLTACTLNITGDVYGAQRPVAYGGYGVYSNNTLSNITITGNVYGGKITNYNYDHHGICFYWNSLTITGNVISYEGVTNFAVHPFNFNQLSVIGSITTTDANPAIFANSTALSEIKNITLSGPFISSPLGSLPFVLRSFNVIPSYNNYIQLRDTSLNTYDLVDPAFVVDAPLPEDVREGVTYSLNSYTGTLAVPLPGQVSLGVPTDDTVGTAVLTADDVWNAQTSAMNTDGSIGKRLKNASTVDSTGDQLSALL